MKAHAKLQPNNNRNHTQTIDSMVPRSLMKNFIIAALVGSTVIIIIANQPAMDSQIASGIAVPLPKEVIILPIPQASETVRRQTRRDLGQLMKIRSRQLKRSCRNIKKLPTFIRKDGNFSVENTQFCLVTKIGSSFLKVFIKEYEKAKSSNLQKQGSKTKKRVLSRKPQTVVFVRDPYKKLFSAYIDKLFSPNPDFWAVLGRPIVRRSRDDNDAVCGTDVSFSELVDELIYRKENGKNIDQHFQPLHGFCDLCKVHYSFIGKMETFVQDVKYLVDVLGPIDDMGFQKFLNKSLIGSPEEVMKLSSRNVFGYRLPAILRCNVTLIEALKLTWKRWQIVGYIERQFSFPENSTSTFPEFYSRALELHRASNKTTLAASKRSFLREAYHTLSHDQKLKLMKIFKPEFDMFGYEPMPDYVFGNKD